MTALSHRDLRVQRTISRGFVAVEGVVLALCVLATWAPDPLLGVLGLTALGACGLGYVLWSDRWLGEYSRDLRDAREESGSNDFRKAEPRSLVDRRQGRSTDPPHASARPGR